MNINLPNYLFLSYYIYLPLSALKVIYNTPNHPFLDVYDLDHHKIYKELISLKKAKQINIRKIKDKITKITEFQDKDWEELKHKIKSWEEKKISIIPYFSENYPGLLKNINNPPKAIFTQGNIDYQNAISIIGTRKPTEYGSEMAKKVGRRFSELGFSIINGFAKGIDILSIQGALEVNGHIIGILGSGLLNLYPKGNLKLFNDILNQFNGGFISEYLPDDSVKKYYLAARNRISSALTLGSVFIEASSESGTKWQLENAKQQGKEIIALNLKAFTLKQSYRIKSLRKSTIAILLKIWMILI